jgi:hypothetical protein
MGLDTKTYWLTDRQSQCDFDFDFDLQVTSYKLRREVSQLASGGEDIKGPPRNKTSGGQNSA